MRPYKHPGWCTVVAFDPGGHVGWAVVSIAPADLASSRRSLYNAVGHFAAGEINGSENNCLDQMIDVIEAWPGAAILTESFQLRQMAVELSPVRMNAVLSWVMSGGDRQLFTQDSGVLRSMPDDRLKRAGARYWTSGSDHARAATKHALHFMRRAREQGGLRGRAWPEYFNRAGGKL